jgi:hypothetical protein
MIREAYLVHRELCTNPVLTAVGTVNVSCPYYLRAHFHRDQFPVRQRANAAVA